MEAKPHIESDLKDKEDDARTMQGITENYHS